MSSTIFTIIRRPNTIKYSLIYNIAVTFNNFFKKNNVPNVRKKSLFSQNVYKD